MSHTHSAVALGILAGAMTVGAQESRAQNLPPLFANLAAEPSDPLIDKVLEDRVNTTIPKDIGASTLRALFEIDGFDIKETETGVTASIKQAKYPCLTDYVVIWGETDTGKVRDLQAVMKQKCY